MKKVLMTLAALLMFSLWIASQDTTLADITIDEDIPVNIGPSEKFVKVDSFLIPLWYKTILQYERALAINDTLFATVNIYESVNGKLIQDYVILSQQKDVLLKMLDNKIDGDSICNKQSQQKDKIIKRDKFLIKIVSGVALIFGILAAL